MLSSCSYMMAFRLSENRTNFKLHFITEREMGDMASKVIPTNDSWKSLEIPLRNQKSRTSKSEILLKMRFTSRWKALLESTAKDIDAKTF